MFTIIKEVFSNTCSTKLQCEVTNDLTLLDCKELEESFLREKTQGLFFKLSVCGLCNDRVDLLKEPVILFDCGRFSFNHVFH